MPDSPSGENRYNPLARVELCHRDLDDDGLSCHLPLNHNGPCAADLFEHLAERAAHGREVNGEHSAIAIDVVVLEAVAWWAEEQITRMARLAESEAHSWSYAHSQSAMAVDRSIRLRDVVQQCWDRFREIAPDDLHDAMRDALGIREFEAKP